jgi:hypothetical protein
MKLTLQTLRVANNPFPRATGSIYLTEYKPERWTSYQYKAVYPDPDEPFNPRSRLIILDTILEGEIIGQALFSYEDHDKLVDDHTPHTVKISVHVSCQADLDKRTLKITLESTGFTADVNALVETLDGEPRTDITFDDPDLYNWVGENYPQLAEGGLSANEIQALLKPRPRDFNS